LKINVGELQEVFSCIIIVMLQEANEVYNCNSYYVFGNVLDRARAPVHQWTVCVIWSISMLIFWCALSTCRVCSCGEHVKVETWMRHRS